MSKSKIKKQENICADIYWKYSDIPGQKFSWWLNGGKCIPQLNVCKNENSAAYAACETVVLETPKEKMHEQQSPLNSVYMTPLCNQHSLLQSVVLLATFA